MTELIDFCYIDDKLFVDQSTAKQTYSKNHFEKYIEYQDFNYSISSNSGSLDEWREIECYQKYVPFSHAENRNHKLLLMIKHKINQFSTEIKIICPKGDVLKVVSQYHRTFLYRKFLQKKSSSTAKINPETGEISICNSFLCHEVGSPLQHQTILLNLMSSITKNKEMIAQIIGLVQDNNQILPLTERKQNRTVTAFMRLCSKKSYKENKIPFQDQQNFEKRRQSKSRTFPDQEVFQSVRRTSGAKQLAKYLNNPLETIQETWEYDNLNMNSPMFKNEVRSILVNVENSLIRKETPLKSIEMIKLPSSRVQSLIKSITSMKAQRRSKRITKIQKAGYGKVAVQIQVKKMSSVDKTYKFLSTLPPQVQLSFMNNYFRCNDLLRREQSKDVIIQLAIRHQELLSYLNSNSNCISFSTKLRILIQLISSSHLLENRYSTMMMKISMRNFSMAKNLMLKINNLEHLEHIDEENKHQLDHSIKIGFVENQVNISRIYSKLFYQKDLIYFQPTKNFSRQRLSHILQNSRHQQKDIIIDKIYEECGLYGPKKLMTLLTSIFMPYIPSLPFQEIKKDLPIKNLKYAIASLVKVLENIQ